MVNRAEFLNEGEAPSNVSLSLFHSRLIRNDVRTAQRVVNHVLEIVQHVRQLRIVVLVALLVMILEDEQRARHAETPVGADRVILLENAQRTDQFQNRRFRLVTQRFDDAEKT